MEYDIIQIQHPSTWLSWILRRTEFSRNLAACVSQWCGNIIYMFSTFQITHLNCSQIVSSLLISFLSQRQFII